MTSYILINILFTAFMTGVIWLIQLVHYPSFRYVSRDQWSQAHQHHTKRISWIVAPMMIAEGICRLYWIYMELNWVSLASSCLILAVWVSTFLIQVPHHQKLEKTYSIEHIEGLVSTNWIRTIGWTLSLAFLVIRFTYDFQ